MLLNFLNFQPVELSYPSIRGRSVRSATGGRGFGGRAARSGLSGARSQRHVDFPAVSGGAGSSGEEDGSDGGGGDMSSALRSYSKFNPGQFEEDSADWHLAMLQFLLDMKEKGHHIKEVVSNKVSITTQEKPTPQDLPVFTDQVI